MSESAPPLEKPALQLKAYKVGHNPLEMRVGPRGAEWMENSGDRFAFRCLPLLMAIQSGWEFICPRTFTAVWNGDADPSGVTVEYEEPTNEILAESHFGEGVLTFHTGWLFQTPPGHNLWVKGPTNRPKHGISALEGMVETDWLPFTFTLNWLFTQPNCPVTFEKGEAVSQILPYPRGYLESFEPLLLSKIDDPTLENEFNTWSQRRAQHNSDLHVPDSEAARRKWERNYTVGLRPDGPQVDSHQMKLDLCPFKKAEDA
jgi:hypothetical protein